MVNIDKLIADNQRRWNNANLNRQFKQVANRLVIAKARYQVIEEQTGVPWHVVAVIHERESGQKWDRSLAQGDRWDRVSTHVPKGRGPFHSFEEAAYDALVNCAPKAAKWQDWSAGGTLTLLEQYNGLGYAKKGIPSPYIWSGTDQYTSGKYVADGVFDATAVDQQLGCAGLLLAMKALDPSITFENEKPIIKAATIPPTAKATGAVAAGGLSAWAWIQAHPLKVAAVTLGIAGVVALVMYLFRTRKEANATEVKVNPERDLELSQDAVPVVKEVVG